MKAKRKETVKHPPIRDAGTLILYRRSRSGTPELLMGERHSGLAFQASTYVFPGGRVDRSDWRTRSATELLPEVREALERAATPTRARALAMSAIRETFEETGLRLAAPDPTPAKPVAKEWEAFFASGYAPRLDTLDYIVRAVTPTFRPRRFNARFFIAPGEDLEGSLRSSGELIDLRWITIEDALKLEIPLITGIVLRITDQYLKMPPKPGARRTVAYYRMSGKKRLVTSE